MPLYEFMCQKCRDLCEILVRNASGKIELKCPACGSQDLQRVISRVHSVVSEGRGGNPVGRAGSRVEERSCPSGTCSTVTLPGHSR